MKGLSKCRYDVTFTGEDGFQVDIEIYEDKVSQSGDRILFSHITIGFMMMYCEWPHYH